MEVVVVDRGTAVVIVHGTCRDERKRGWPSVGSSRA